jgi:hypothetical protein
LYPKRLADEVGELDKTRFHFADVQRILKVTVQHINHPITKAPKEKESADQREGDRVALAVDAEHFEEILHKVSMIAISTILARTFGSGSKLAVKNHFAILRSIGRGARLGDQQSICLVGCAVGKVNLRPRLAAIRFGIEA